MDRHDVKREDGHVWLKDDEWIEVGKIEDIVALAGGPTYTVEYADAEATAAWLSLDDQQVLEFDVVETLVTMDFPTGFVSTIAAVPIDEGEKYPRRTEVFVDTITSIWDAKGNPESEGN
ncbi:hypothetical protein [Halorussus salinisoli]|uniref:hypothetical protein n=1 Tax=Halorussus salinisoli TaxID=2558242 RepID=UPI0010C17790|nr:hypothetical protein [Halorussus salinisoli]